MKKKRDSKFTQKWPTIYGLDFDGTCVTHQYPEIGVDIGAVPVLKKIINKGDLIILNTVRSGKPLEDAVEWFKDNQIPLYGINENPAPHFSDSPKVYAHIYIDDAALGAPLIFPEVGRPYIDWKAVERLLDLNTNN